MFAASIGARRFNAAWRLFIITLTDDEDGENIATAAVDEAEFILIARR